MLTQLSTLKLRLPLDPLDPTYDALLLRAIDAVSARFDQETNRILARTENALYEFSPGETEILVPCYPIETVAKFELKTSESTGWIEQLNVDYLIRRSCVISLSLPCLLYPASASLARVTYTGGYLLPGSAEDPSATTLPADLEHAAIEQAAYWFQTRDKLGLLRQWPHGGTYEQFADPDLLPSVRAILDRHARCVI